MLRFLAVLLGIALILPGAGAQAQGRAQVVVAIWDMPSSILPPEGGVSGYLNSLIHDILAETDTKGQVVPRLATKWERSADGLTYTVHLRQARFQDGRPVTADDVKFSYELFLNSKYPGPVLTLPALLEIKGAPEYRRGQAQEIVGITVVDPRTLRFTLNRRYAFFVGQILGGRTYIVPKHALEGADFARIAQHPYARRPIGAGPYRLVDWRDRDSMTFQPFPGYWGGTPSPSRVVIRLIPEPATRMAELRAGNIDAGQILPDEFESFQRNPQLQVLRWPGDVVFLFMFNYNHSVFSDVRVRQAFYHAIDRETMVRTLHRGFGRVVNTVVHPSVWQHNSSLKGYEYNPARARQLLGEAGFTPGPGGILQRDGRPLRVRYGFVAERRNQDQALMIQQFLRQAGVDLVLEPRELGDFFRNAFNVGNAPNIDMLGLPAFNFLVPLQGELQTWFGSSGFVARIFQYNNPELDALLDRASTATDRGTLKTIYFRVQELVSSDVPAVFLFRPDEIWAIQKRLTVPKSESLIQFFQSISRWK